MVNNGASSNPCSETFAGPTPFSEPETIALAKFIEEHAAQTKIYLSFHTYGQYILYPYGHSYEPTAHDAVLVLLSTSYLKDISINCYFYRTPLEQKPVKLSKNVMEPIIL